MDREILVVRGRLDRSGRFTLKRSRSTSFVRQWPVIEEHEREIVIELLDRSGQVLHREWASLRPEIGCEPGATQTFRVIAYIGLRDDAAEVRLVRGEVQLWRDSIPEAAELKVQLGKGRPTRESPVVLRLRYSDAGENAHVTVVYQWGPRRFRPIYIGPPSREMIVSLRDLPGGDECRLVVSYSNGLRSAHDATPSFRLPALGAALEVVRPENKARLLARTPLILEGMVSDPESAGGAKAEELVWLMDGKEIGSGSITSVDGLTAGRHRLTLKYRGFTKTITVRVEEPAVQTAGEWPDWDPFSANQ